MKQSTFIKEEEIQKWPLQMNKNEGEPNNVVIHNNTPPLHILSTSFPKTTGEILSLSDVDIPSEDKKPGTKSKIYRDYHVILAEESPKINAHEDFSDESTYNSINYVETDLCWDSGDTESESNSSFSAKQFIMEYEVATASSSAELYSNDSSSGDDEYLIAAAVAANSMYLTASSSIDSVGTDQESTDLCDSELSSADYWYCVKCKNRQNNPMFRYCEKCYQIRKTHFPPRPRKKKRRSASKRSFSTWNSKEMPVSTSLLQAADVRKSCSSPIYVAGGNSNFNMSRFLNLKRKASYDGIFNDCNRNGKQIRYKKRKINYKNISDSSSGEESSNCGSSNFYKNDTKPNINQTADSQTYSTNNNGDSTTVDRKGQSNEKKRKRMSKIAKQPATVNHYDDHPIDLQKKIFIKRTNAIDEAFSDSEANVIIDHLAMNSQKDSGFSSGFSSQELPGVTIKSTNIPLGNALLKDHNDSDSSDTVTEELNDNDLNELAKEINNSNSFTGEFDYNATIVNGFSLSTEQSTHNEVSQLLNGIDNMINSNNGIPFSLDRRQSDLPQASLTNPQIARSVSACSDAYTNTSNNTDIFFSSKVKVVGLDTNSSENSENSQYGSCMTCLSGPKNGVFVHSRFLHLCCCYKCAVKIWNKNKKCPICNCAVKNVMKLFVH